MAKITLGTDLNEGTEYTLTLAVDAIRVTLTEAGNLVEADGVTGVALFSALETGMRTKTDSHKYRMPFFQGTGELGSLLEMRGGSEITAGDETFIRDTGVRYRSGYGGSDTVTAEYLCLVQAGNLAASTDQPYILKDGDSAPTNLNFTGDFNELVQIYGDASHGSIDKRTSLKIYCREQGKTFGFYDLTVEQNITTLLPVTYLIPMDTATDPNIVASDASIGTDAPYTGMSCFTTLDGNGFSAASVGSLSVDDVRQDTAGRWFICTTAGTIDAAGVADYTTNGGTAVLAAYSGERLVNGTYYAYNKIINGNSGTIKQIHTFHNFKLRQTSDIDLHATLTQRGDIAAPLFTTSAAGDAITTATGVYIDNYQTSEGPGYTFTDVNGGTASPASVVTVQVSVSDVWQGDANGWYRCLFTNGSGSQDFDNANAVTVQDASSSDVAGTSADATGSAGSYIISFTFDYTNNSQAGLPANTDKPVTFICGGNGTSGGAKFKKAQFTITNNTLVTASCEADQETNGA